jgi:membrane protein required for colicin V production
MTALDYFVLVILGLSVALGAIKGILKGAIAVVSALAGLLAAAHFYASAAPLFRWLVSTDRAASLIGFVAIFLAFIIAGAIASRALRKWLRRARLDWTDHLLGALFGLARGWLICSAAYLALTAFPVRLEAVQKAQFAPFLIEGTKVISYLGSNELRRRFLESYEALREIWAKARKNKEQARGK